jgi:DNA-binding beta-propeller fold protein YncE
VELSGNAEDAWVALLDAQTGKLLGTFASVGASGVGITVDERPDRVFLASSAGVTVDDAVTAKALRTFAPQPALGFPSYTPRVVVDEATGRAYVLSGASMSQLSGASVKPILTTLTGLRTLVFDRRHGHIDILALSGPYASPVAGDGRLLLLDERTGVVQRMVTVGTSPSIVALDPARGRVFVLNTGVNLDGRTVHEAGSVTVLDARRGSVTATLPAGIRPDDLAVDTATGHALVLSQGGTVGQTAGWSWFPSWLRCRLPFMAPAGVNGQPARLMALNPSN